MANYEKNLKGINEKRTPAERRELARKAGIASGKARRKKANFKRVLNELLTTEIDNPDWTPVLEAMGLDSTLETALLAAQIKEAMDGNTKAAYFVAQYAGQDTRSDEDLRDLQADIDLKKARKADITGENESTEALDKLDKILEEIYKNAAEQKTE